MTRIPDDLARDLVEWAADEMNAMKIDERGTDVCVFCGFRDHGYGSAVSGTHAADCLHIRALYWLAAEKAARDWKPKAVEVTYRYDGKLTHAGEDAE